MASSLTLLFAAVLLAGSAAAAPAGIEQIEHIVIFMQENRAFDHYYGLLKGVRGFADHTAPPLPSGRDVWYQPTDKTNTSGAYMLPFHVDFQTTSGTCMGRRRNGAPSPRRMLFAKPRLFCFADQMPPKWVCGAPRPRDPVVTHPCPLNNRLPDGHWHLARGPDGCLVRLRARARGDFADALSSGTRRACPGLA